MHSANISHEMRTPLSTTISFTDLLLSTEKDNSRRKQLEIIKFSSILMLNNVNDTLDNAQIKRGIFQKKLEHCFRSDGAIKNDVENRLLDLFTLEKNLVGILIYNEDATIKEVDYIGDLLASLVSVQHENILIFLS